MNLNRLHTATVAPTPVHIKTREDKGDVRPHARARRVSSDDSGRPKTPILENSIITIPELTESLEKRLCLREKKTMSLNDDDKLCLICHEDMCKNGGAVQELHCAHRFHKEVKHLFRASVHPFLCKEIFSSSPSMSDIRLMVHECGPFLNMHDVNSL
ncbi:hypothetical protein LDENG_00268370 [Lucifuga dentata]|nr:hypothetical protein LDENG_00268370 [Lucifuga dentata]